MVKVMASGMEMLLKASGINIEQITKDFTLLKENVVNILTKIDERLIIIENKQSEINEKIETIMLLQNSVLIGLASMIGDEEWQKIMKMERNTRLPVQQVPVQQKPQV